MMEISNSIQEATNLLRKNRLKKKAWQVKTNDSAEDVTSGFNSRFMGGGYTPTVTEEDRLQNQAEARQWEVETKDRQPDNYQEMVKGQSLKQPIYDPTDIAIDAMLGFTYSPLKAGTKAIAKTVLREIAEGGAVGAGMVGVDKLGGGIGSQLAGGLAGGMAGKTAMTGVRRLGVDLLDRMVKKGADPQEAATFVKNIEPHLIERNFPNTFMPEAQKILPEAEPAKALTHTPTDQQVIPLGSGMTRDAELSELAKSLRKERLKVQAIKKQGKKPGDKILNRVKSLEEMVEGKSNIKVSEPETVEKAMPFEMQRDRLIETKLKEDGILSGQINRAVRQGDYDQLKKMGVAAEPDFSPADIKPSAITEKVDPVAKKEIVQHINKKFAPWRTGRTPEGARGIFKIKPEVIRSKVYGDVQNAMHEVGHFLDKKLKRTNIGDDELLMMGKETSPAGYSPDDIKNEGVAQFFKRYFINPQQAAEDAPKYFSEIDPLIKGDPELKGSVDELRGLVKRWYGQSPSDRIGSTITYYNDTKPFDLKSRAKKLQGYLHRQLFDRTDPLGDLGKQAENHIKEMRKRGVLDKDTYDSLMYKGKLRGDIDPQLLLKRSSGARRAGDLDKEAFERFVDREIRHEEYKPLNEYMKAMRLKDAHKAGIKTQEASFDDIEKTIKKTPEKIKKHADKIFQMNNKARKKLLDAGIINKGQYHAWGKKWPHYTPFFRDLSDEEISRVFNPTRQFTGGSHPTFDHVQSSYDNIDIINSIIAKNDAKKPLYELSKVEGMGSLVEDVTGTKPGLGQTDNIVNVMVDGQKKQLKVDPDVNKMFNRLPTEGRNLIYNTLSIFPKVLKMGAVDFSLPFFFRNAQRDSVTSAIFSENDLKPFYSWFKGFVHYAKKDNAYKRAVKAGIGQSTLTSWGHKNSSKKLQKMVERSPEMKAIQKILKSPFDFLEWLNQGGEMASRIAEHEAGLRKLAKQGRKAYKANKPRVDWQGHDVTLAFSQGGEASKWMNAMSAFYNAGMLSFEKLGRAIKEHPVRTTSKIGMYITLPSVLNWAMNHDDPAYQEMPQWKKILFWHIPVGDGKFIPIAKPFLPGILFGSVPEAMLQSAYEEDPRAFKDFGENIRKSIPSIAITAFGPAMDVSSGRSSFFDTPIVPQYQEDMPEYMQFGPNTSELAKILGEFASNFTEGGVSPRNIDYLTYGYTGTAGRQLMGLIDKGFEMIGKRPPSPDSDFGEGWLVETPFRNSQSITDFYDMMDRLGKIENELKANGYTKYSITEKDKRRLLKRKDLQKLRTGLSKIWKMRREIMNSPTMSPADKRKKLDTLNITAMNMARIGIDKKPIKAQETL